MTRGRLEFRVVAFTGVVHVGALLGGILFFSVPGLAALITLYLATGFGVTVGYHRLLTHRSFHAGPTLFKVFAVLGLLSGEGPPVFWVAHHRKHHALSDQVGDPHRPADGLLWAHALWTLRRLERRPLGALYNRYAPDLARDPFCVRLETTYFRWHLGLAAVLAMTGLLCGGWRLAASLVSYGFLLRMVGVLHATWLVNSVAHRFGSQPYRTADESRNHALVALLALGEGWHNNHHHAPSAANHGHHVWEIDLSYLLIRAMAALSEFLARLSGGRLRPVSRVKVYRADLDRVVTLQAMPASA